FSARGSPDDLSRASRASDHSAVIGYRQICHYTTSPFESAMLPIDSVVPADRMAKRSAIACGAAALLGGLLYLNALHNPFVYDDYHIVVENPSIRHLGNLRGILLYRVTRPIVNLSYAIDRALWGTQPFGFHVTNVLLHMLN